MEDPLVDSEILHNGEGEDLEQWLKLRNKSFLFVIALLSLLHLLCFYSFILLIITHLNKKATEHLNSYLEESRGEVQTLHGESDFNSCFS